MRLNFIPKMLMQTQAQMKRFDFIQKADTVKASVQMNV